MVDHTFPRIFYFGLVNTPGYAASLNANIYSGAASHKMISVMHAVRKKKVKAAIVTLPHLNYPNSPYFVGGSTSHQDGCCVVSLSSSRGKLSRRLLGCIGFARAALLLVRQGDIVIFYNHHPVYFLALVLLRVRAILCIQDIEDVPLSEDQSMVGRWNKACYRLLFRLTAPSKIVVSRQVGKSEKISNFFAIQGIADNTNASVNCEKWNRLVEGAPLLCHYGGTLVSETGLDLFCESLIALDACKSDGPLMQFVITGLGNFERIKRLSKRLKSPVLRIEIHENVTHEIYESLLKSCHVSLSLRDPQHEYAKTTFPSKVIEAASAGLACLTTRVSDLPLIFEDDEAFYLDSFDPSDLAKLLWRLSNSPESVRAVALAGQQVARSRFNADNVGSALVNFLRQVQTD